MKVITMKKTGVTNPARAGFVPFTSASSDLGDYLRKVNSVRSLEANEEKIDEVKNPAVKRMLEYINENLTSIHKVEDVASALFFSDSDTRTLFKQEMKIGIMEYVRSKKVLLAHRKIRHGASPTEIYAECGFSNYTSFYRAYVSQLGHTPRAQLKL